MIDFNAPEQISSYRQEVTKTAIDHIARFSALQKQKTEFEELWKVIQKIDHPPLKMHLLRSFLSLIEEVNRQQGNSNQRMNYFIKSHRGIRRPHIKLIDEELEAILRMGVSNNKEPVQQEKEPMQARPKPKKSRKPRFKLYRNVIRKMVKPNDFPNPRPIDYDRIICQALRECVAPPTTQTPFVVKQEVMENLYGYQEQVIQDQRLGYASLFYAQKGFDNQQLDQAMFQESSATEVKGQDH